MVHRDLKPSNVLIAEDGPRVIDFAISRAAESTALTQAGLVIGSPGFMFPEQAAGFEVGPPSDIFSLGAVLAFAATGEGPFGAGTTAALLYRVVHGAPGLDRIPSEVRPLIERCRAKDPSQRPTAAGLLAEVGALQPRVNWLPGSIIRAFARDTPSGPAPDAAATPATPAPAPGSLAALGFAGELATQTAAAGAGAQVPSGEACCWLPQAIRRPPPWARHILEIPIVPGVRIISLRPVSPARRLVQPAPARREKPAAAPLWRPMVLVWIIAGMIAAGVAGFAVTSFAGGARPPRDSPPRTDVLSGIIHVRRTWRPWCVWLRVLLLGCLPERVLLSERSSVIVPGHVAVGERVRIRIGACLPVAVRVPSHHSSASPSSSPISAPPTSASPAPTPTTSASPSTPVSSALVTGAEAGPGRAD